jgi:clan AA aspartic protease (TIGR02281 family)
MKNTLIAAGLAILALSPLRAEDDCKRIVILTSLEMLPSSGNRVIVPATTGGQPLRMIVDTGGYLTALSEDKAQDLGLPISVYPESRMVLFGGHALRRLVTLNDFGLGRFKAKRMEYPLLPPGAMEQDADGLLSPDFLGNFDLDFDFTGGKLNLVSKDHCDGRVGYWTNLPLIGIPITREEDGVHISTRIQINGREVKALIDTGAPHSAMSLELAQDIFGFADDDPKLVSLPAGPNRTTGAKRYPIPELKLGDVVVKNPNIVLMPENQMRMGPRSPRMILGLSVLRQLHLYIAYREKMIYATPASEHR